MKVCIAEKPSVAREIADILGAKSKKDGYFEGNGYQVTWTFGHLCTLKAPDEYTPDWKKWSLVSLPMIPEKFDITLIKNKGVSNQFNVIKKLVNNCSEVINCGDAGIEGELIQRWVLKKASCDKKVKRLWISSLTDEAIREGFLNLKDSSQYDLLYAAGNARAIGDWLLGMNASRLFTLKYADGKGVLSIGRVQTPTLALIVQRHLDIENFKPEKYWELKTVYRDVIFNATDGRFKSKEEGDAVLQNIKDIDFSIVDFSRKQGKEKSPSLFDLTSLQVECNKRFAYTADNTLKIVQKLYEKKLVSYPRVDTRFLPSDVYPKVPGILNKLEDYKKFTDPLLAGGIQKSKKVFDDKKVTDHHAIIPTGLKPGNVTPQEETVYDAIARRFISVFYPDCIVLNTTVLGEVKDVKFKANGKVIIEEGWRILYPKQDTRFDPSDDKTESQIIPEFMKGEMGPHKPELQEKETTPPKYYTEATLLRAMETAGKQVDDDELREAMKENGIGRPSTRANIIETLFKRTYILRAKKNIIPTIAGVQLIASIKNDLLKSVELTGIWEKKLRQIERGDYKAGQFLNEMKEMVSSLVNEVRNASGNTINLGAQKGRKAFPARVKKKNVNDSKKKENINNDEKKLVCPKCGIGTMIRGKAAYGCNRFREGCHFVIPYTELEARYNSKELTGKFLDEIFKSKEFDVSSS